MKSKTGKKIELIDIKDLTIPNHVAIIVDGNGRWAEKKGKTRSEGHKAGADRIEKISKYIFEKGTKYLSLFVFSTENFKRSKDEVDYLMDLFRIQFKKIYNRLHKENIKIVFSGREHPLSSDIIKMMNEIEEKTKNNDKGTINFCLNYGGRAEIVDACKKFSNDVTKKKIKPEDLNEEVFNSYLYNDLPQVDFLIRTSGEQRISNFLLWGLSYAEFYFPDTCFPGFNEKEYDLALLVFNKRNRRFGGIKYEN
jgi:undecaprenyl diphosphate synthase